MQRTSDLSPIARFAIAALFVGVTVAVAACSDDGADPAAYFDELERSQATLDTTVGELFESPTAQELEGIDEDGSELTSEQESVVRRFVTEFWSGATDAVVVHVDEVEKLDVPEVAEDAHRDYVEALDGLIATRDEVIAKAHSTNGAELLADFWEPDPQVELVDATCLAMAGLAASEGFTITLPLCSEG